jgi:hypothetical protein
MNEQRTTQGNGASREPARRVSMGDGQRREALGDVARDMMDQVSIMARDEVRLARLSARRYVEHLRGDVAPRALWATVAGVTAMLAGIFLAIAIFWGIAVLIGSVAWTFVIFAAFCILGSVLAISAMRRTQHAETAADIERRFPAVRADKAGPEHAIARLDSEEGHRERIAEAQRETSRELLPARNERVPPPEARVPDRR